MYIFVECQIIALQGDIEVDLDDDVTPSATPVRQLRSPAERSPTAKAVAAMAEKLQQKGQEAALTSGQKVPIPKYKLVASHPCSSRPFPCCHVAYLRHKHTVSKDVGSDHRPARLSCLHCCVMRSLTASGCVVQNQPIVVGQFVD